MSDVAGERDRTTPTTALVLSGGGMRGAYAAGVLCGVIDVLELGPDDPPPFTIFAGTSSGAINATFLAANAHRGDLGVEQLARIWTGLQLRDHLRFNVRSWLPGRRRERSLLNPRAIARTIDNGIDWDQLDDNARTGALDALFVTALDAARGVTTMFSHLRPSSPFEPSRDPRRHAEHVAIRLQHVLASMAIPLVFPPQRIDDSDFFDGGLRFNTPIGPAIRANADRLVIVSASRQDAPTEDVLPPVGTPGVPFVLGKLLNALLIGPFEHDLNVLERINALMAALDDVLEPHERERIDGLLVRARGASYRQLSLLHLAPTGDIGQLAGAYLEEHLAGWDLDRMPRWLLRRAAEAQDTSEADWAAFILFDGGFAERLIRMGRDDSHARADEITAFFNDDTRAGQPRN